MPPATDMPAVTDIAVPLPGGQLMVQDAGPPDGLPVLVYSGSPGSRHLSPTALRLAGRKDLRLIGPREVAGRPDPGRRSPFSRGRRPWHHRGQPRIPGLRLADRRGWV